MKCAYFVFAFISFVCFSTIQGFAQAIWFEGEVVMANGRSYKGEFHFSLERDNLQIRSAEDGRLYTINAPDVYSFSFYDSHRMGVRTFYSLPYTYRSGYQRYQFFELLMDGFYTLLNRESVVGEGNLHDNELHLFYTVQNREGMRYKDNFYVLNERGIFKAGRDMSEFLMLFPEEIQPELRNLARVEVLHSINRRNISRILQHFNLQAEGLEQ